MQICVAKIETETNFGRLEFLTRKEVLHKNG
jgi:hypothetical protein